MTIVTFDGDGNGATSLQTKIQLWNKAGSGWPDVIFSEQVNDPIWMAQDPVNFAADMGAALGKSVTGQWPAPSLAQCTVNGTLVCIQDNVAPDVLWVNQKLMTQFGYTVRRPGKTGRRSATRSPPITRVTSSALVASRTARGSTISGRTSARWRRTCLARRSRST